MNTFNTTNFPRRRALERLAVGAAAIAAPALGRASSELERELDALVATLVGLVEPLVLLLMGGLVLMMVLAILLPIINLNNLVTL